MTDFNEWYARENPDLNPLFDHCLDELRRAYEAGAASQAETLRDKFAGKAMIGMMSGNITCDNGWVVGAFEFADAMLEARKTTGEGE
jgi:hypothetical protein